ncbi:MAG: PRC-barrel domain-containing protein [Pseudomonadota bacterium]
MKTYFIGAMAALTLGAAAIAQTETDTTAPQTDGGAEVVASEPALVPVDEVIPEELAGVNVVGTDGEGIGRVTDIVFTSLGEVEAAVVSTGGFLGFGRHSVAIPVEELEVLERADQPGALVVQLPMTQDDLKAMPEVGAEEEVVTQ